MSKSIYEEVLEIIDRNIFELPEGFGILYEIRKKIQQAQKQEKLLELYKQAYDKSNAEVLKMFTDEQDEKTTLSNIIGHLDDRETVVQIRELENE